MAKNKVGFEQALKRLEEIVGLLEEGDKPLEESLKLFEEGINLAKLCSKRLKEAEKKVEILKHGDSEEQKLEPFKLDEDSGKKAKGKKEQNGGEGLLF